MLHCFRNVRYHTTAAAEAMKVRSQDSYGERLSIVIIIIIVIIIVILIIIIIVIILIVIIIVIILIVITIVIILIVIVIVIINAHGDKHVGPRSLGHRRNSTYRGGRRSLSRCRATMCFRKNTAEVVLISDLTPNPNLN